VSGVFVWDYR